jgi:hypothetical protein
MNLVDALRYFEPLEPDGTPVSRPDDFWTAYASGLVAQASYGRMEIGQDVVSAAFEVIRSRPKTILSALHLARTPFPVTWLEWVMVPPAEIRRRGWLIVEHKPGTYKAILFGRESDDAIVVAGIGAILWSGNPLLDLASRRSRRMDPVIHDEVRRVHTDDEQHKAAGGPRMWRQQPN